MWHFLTQRFHFSHDFLLLLGIILISSKSQNKEAKGVIISGKSQYLRKKGKV